MSKDWLDDSQIIGLVIN